MSTASGARAARPAFALGQGAGRLALAAPLAAFAAVCLYFAVHTDVRGPAAVPELARGVAAAAALFAVAGYAPARLLVPASMARHLPLFVLPVGAVISSLALTLLGFARVPLVVSLALVLAAGVVGATFVRRRGRAPTEPADRLLPAYAIAGLLVACVVLLPSFRAGYATPPGENPDALVVSGIAQLLQEAPPTAVRPELPVDEMREEWQSKYPIFYSLAAVSKLSGLEPLSAFPAVLALLTVFVGLGFALFAIHALGVSSRVGLFVAVATGCSAMTLYVALLPYWNQLWGLAAFPFALLFGWQAVAHRDARAMLLFALTVLLAGLAYPLMLPYPLLAALGFAIALKRRPPLPDWSRGRWLVAGGIVLELLAVPLAGVVEKARDAARVLFDPGHDLHGWAGPLDDFLPFGSFVSVGGGLPALLAVTAFAVFGLTRVPRAPALALGGLLALSALADVRLRVAEFGAYFDFKHLAFVGPLLITLAAIGAAELVSRRRPALVAIGAAAIAAWSVSAAVQVGKEVDRRYGPVTPALKEIGRWSDDLPAGTSVRIDVPPSGWQHWVAYFLADHPVNTPRPDTHFPHAPAGTRADYSLSPAHPLSSNPALRRLRFMTPPNAIDPPLRQNDEWVLRRLEGAPGAETASRRAIQPGPGQANVQPR